MIKVRPVNPRSPDEWAFVSMNWRASFEPESQVARMCGAKAYKRFMTRYVEALRTETGAYTLIVTPDNDDDHFLGFAVAKEPELHYVYVKPEFRKTGLARALLEGRGIAEYTFTTLLGRERLRPDERGWRSRPRNTL